MKRGLLLLLFLLLIAACSLTRHTVTVGEIAIPEKPRADRQINVRYQIDSLIPADEKHIQLTLYYTVKNKIYAIPVKYSAKGRKIKATFLLPDTAQAFALKAQADYLDANDKNGYVSPVYNAAGSPVAGGLAGISLFYNDIGTDHIGSYLLTRPVDKDTALKLMQEDFTAHPRIKPAWTEIYLNTLLAVKEKAAYPEIETTLQQMLASDSVKTGDYAIAYNLFLKMDLWNKADTAMKSGAEKFPDGPMAKKLAEDRFYSFGKSIDSMLARYRDFKREFPTSDSANTLQTIQNRMLATIAAHYADSGNYKQFLFYLSQINDPVQKASICNFWFQTFVRKNIALSLADSLAKASLNLIRQASDDPEAMKQSYQTDKDWKRVMQYIYAWYAENYATFLYREGKIKKAVSYQADAVKYREGRYTKTNQRYVQYLMENKDYKMAREQSAQFIADGNATDKTVRDLKSLYIRLNGSEKGYTAYYDSLEEKAKVRMKSRLVNRIINEPAPDFTLTDLKGRPVSLSALKGKVVVLDFWATWCGPCKASFPGMQQVIDRFKNDTNIVFLFVNSFEDAPAEKRRKIVSDFITDHNYTFRVLLDRQQAKDTTKYQLASDYHTEAIPTKFVISPEGNIRFKTVGFTGNTAMEINKMLQMIAMARH